MSSVNAAVDLFRNGCACSQAILGAYGPRYGLDEDRAMRVAAGFGGGMRLGETCGAVTGALMVLGLAHCTSECRTKEDRKDANSAVTAFATEFRERHQSLLCRELLGCDISTAEGLKAAQDQDLFASRCVELVRDAATILERMLTAPSPRQPELG
jgi:C_GCAxxG_C_C family probable redox protein